MDTGDNNIIQQIYKFVDIKRDDKAIDLLFYTVDYYMRNGQFDLLDKLIQEIDLDKLSLSLMIGVLTITLPAKKQLLSREAIYDKIKEKIIQLDPERVDRLLVGLK